MKRARADVVFVGGTLIISHTGRAFARVRVLPLHSCKRRADSFARPDALSLPPAVFSPRFLPGIQIKRANHFRERVRNTVAKRARVGRINYMRTEFTREFISLTPPLRRCAPNDGRAPMWYDDEVSVPVPLVRAREGIYLFIE